MEGDEEKSCWIQAGIASWGWGCGQTLIVNGVANTQIPEYYTNVLALIDWIKETIATNGNEPSRIRSVA